MSEPNEIDQHFFQLIDLIHAWVNTPALVMNLSENQQNFVRDQNIYICTAYIGMVRLYKDNRTIWQTSASKVICDAIEKSFEPEDFSVKSPKTILENTKADYQSLSLQCSDFLNKLMLMSEEERSIAFNTNMPLF